VQYLGEVMTRRTPIPVSEIFEENGEEVKLRGTLFPLSSNGDDIDAVLGAANCERQEALKIRDSAA
jgi:hypothetical protein